MTEEEKRIVIGGAVLEYDAVRKQLAMASYVISDAGRRYGSIGKQLSEFIKAPLQSSPALDAALVDFPDPKVITRLAEDARRAEARKAELRSFLAEMGCDFTD